MAVKMRLIDLRFDELSDVPVAWLGGDGVTLPVCLGVTEAAELALLAEADGAGAAPPSARQLAGRILDALGATLVRVELYDLQSARFHARVAVSLGARQAELDCRPAEALALALRHDLPIEVADRVLARVAALRAEAPAPPSTPDWSAYLRELEPQAFGKYEM